MRRVVDRGGRLAEAGGDELHFPGKGGHVAGGVDSSDIGLHLGVDPDGIIPLQLQSPVGHRTQVGGEAETGQNGIDAEDLLCFRLRVDDHHLSDVRLPPELFRPAGELDRYGRVEESPHILLVGAELLSPVDERNAAGDLFQVKRPVHSRVAAADDQYLLPQKLISPRHRVIEALTLERLRSPQAPGGVHSQPGGDNQRPAPMLCPVGEDPEALLPGRRQLLDALAKTDCWPTRHGLFDQVPDEILRQDLREAGHVIDILLRIGGRELSAELGQAVDDLGGEAPEAGIVGGEQAGRSTADDRNVMQVARLRHWFLRSFSRGHNRFCSRCKDDIKWSGGPQSKGRTDLTNPRLPTSQDPWRSSCLSGLRPLLPRR